MKRKCMLLLSSLFLFGCTQQQEDVYLFSFFKGNGEDGLHLAYSKNGYNWTALNNNKSFLIPAAGDDKLMRDPCIILGGDNKFHMVWTVSWNEKGIGYASSEDLIHWSDQKFIPVMTHEPDARNCWAPELYYDNETGQYLIYWATTIPGRFHETDSTGDNGYNHRMYYTLTTNFTAFSETRLLYDKGFNVIDATIKKTDDRFTMFLKNETLLPQPEKNIRIAFSDSLYLHYSEASEPITDHWVEGPTVLKLSRGWIVYFDKYREKQMGAVYSENLTEWTDISDKINFPEGTRHGSAFKVKESVVENILSFTQNAANTYN
jgi:hypothetical protein